MQRELADLSDDDDLDFDELLEDPYVPKNNIVLEDSAPPKVQEKSMERKEESVEGKEESLEEKDSLQEPQTENAPTAVRQPLVFALRAPQDSEESRPKSRSPPRRNVRFDQTAEKLTMSPNEDQKMAFRRLLIQRRGKRIVQKIMDRAEKLDSSNAPIDSDSESDSSCSDSDSSSSYSENLKQDTSSRETMNKPTSGKTDESDDSRRLPEAPQIFLVPWMATREDTPVLITDDEIPVKSVDRKELKKRRLRGGIRRRTPSLSSISEKETAHIAMSVQPRVYISATETSMDVDSMEFSDTQNHQYDDESESEPSYGGHALVFPEDMSVPEIELSLEEPIPKKKQAPEEKRARSISPNFTKREKKQAARRKTGTKFWRASSQPPRVDNITIKSESSKILQQDVFQFLPSQSVFGTAFQKLLDSDDASLQTCI